jgi:nitroimidazol reductase NimA-like FMN-containing flavoprotein (pyridoxamine 5'-phosphate oxidase superfamily)
VYDKGLVHAILDEGFICHIGFVADGQPYSLPTIYGRTGERLFIHGSAASRMLRALDAATDICLTVTLVDGLVMARSALYHSLNYRSVVVLGKALLLTDAKEKLAALRSITNHVVPGRWEEIRHPSERELKATGVMALDLDEVSAKVRSGTVVDDERDYALPVWAGVVPLRCIADEPVPDDRVLPDVRAFDLSRLARFRRMPGQPKEE